MSWLSGRRHFWTPTPAYSRAIVVPILLTGLALVLGRVELALLGAPLALSLAAAHGSFTRPAREWTGAAPLAPAPEVNTSGPGRVEAGRHVRLATTVQPSDAQMVTVVLPPDVQDGDGARTAVRAPARAEPARRLVTDLELTTWGTHELARPDYAAATPDAYWVAGPAEAASYSAHVLPAVTTRLPPGPLPPRPSGMVGAHRTRRPGDGTDLHEIAPFAPGDRLRRVDWRVTARQAGPDEQLYARRTLVDADADVMCCMDNRFDLSDDAEQWSGLNTVGGTDDAPAAPRTSIDIAVDTVSSLAAGYLAQGDRVGLIDLCSPASMVRPGSGSRHLLRLRSHLARHTHRPGAADRGRLSTRLPPVAPGSIIVITSVFIDDDVAELAVAWRRAGHPVLAVDVLPQPVRSNPKARAMSLALRIVLAERAERLAGLRARGVAVTSAEPSKLALGLTRLARAPRRNR